MEIRDRVKELRRIKAGELIPNPKNWRTHPAAQQDALRGVLEEVGYADALIARETPDGLMLIDGHLRAETTPGDMVPVLVLDVSEAEADVILATLDPLAAMAAANDDQITALLESVSVDNESVNALLQSVADGYEPLAIPEPDLPDESFDVDDALDEVDVDNYIPRVQPGEIWSLGQHRLMCGDATSEGNVVALMGDETPSLMVTDPPYGVDYDPNWRNIGAEEGWLKFADGTPAYAARRVGLVTADTRADWSDAWRLFPGDVVYCWSAAGALQLRSGLALRTPRRSGIYHWTRTSHPTPQTAVIAHRSRWSVWNVPCLTMRAMSTTPSLAPARPSLQPSV